MKLFKLIKMYFKERDYYEQRKRYMKLQKAFRKEMVKQSKEFCPWSGWYMHKMIVTMLEFYHKTYAAGDCCWSAYDRVKKKASQLEKTLQYAKALDTYEDMEEAELLAIADKEPGFKKYVEKWEKKTGTKANPKLMYGIAWDYFEKKYTEGMYTEIGKHIWEWCD
jgi:oligoendopeptidase F